MKRWLLALLLVLFSVFPVWAQQSTKNLLSTYAPSSSNETELTDLSNTSAITDINFLLLSSFTLTLANGSTRTIEITLRVTRDGVTESTGTYTVPTGTRTIQLNSTATGLSVASHTWRSYVTTNTTSGVTYTTASNHYLGNVTGVSVVNTSGALMADGSVTATGNLPMGTKKITGLGTPTVSTDAATKAYADLMLPLTGGTMSGAIAMGTSKITGLGTPTVGTDAATKTYADGLVSGLTGYMKLDGTTPLTGVWPAGDFNVGLGANTFLTLPHNAGTSDLVDQPDFFWDSPHKRLHLRSLLIREVGDPPDLMIGRSEGTYPDTRSVNGLANGSSIGAIYWMASCGSACGFQNRAAQIYVRNTMVPTNGHTGGDMWFQTTLTNDASATDRLVIRNSGKVTIMNNKPFAILNGAGNADLSVMNMDSSNQVEIARDSAIARVRHFGIQEFYDTSAGGTQWMGLSSGILQLNNANLLLRSVLQAALGSPSNGTLVYCSDCTTATACTGGGSGALASRQNGAWKCL